MSLPKDKRLFKRYPYKTEFFLSSKDDSIKAVTTDYSLKGVGFYIDNPPPFLIDSNIHFTIKDLNLDEDGSIIWSKKTSSRISGGIERKAISGRLKHYPLADILLDMHRSEKNGILEVSKDRIIKRIYIRNGDMVYATSNMAEDRFIEVLLHTGKITDDQYYQVINISKKSGKSQGSALVELGFLKPEDLILAVQRQVEQIILTLFQWEDGGFAMIERPIVTEKLITLKLSAANLIYRGIKSMKSTASIKEAMPGNDAVLCYSSDPMDLFQDIQLDTHDKAILHTIDGRKSIGEIVSLSPIDALQTMKTLYALLSTRIIDIKEKDMQEDTVEKDILKERQPESDPDFLKKVEDVFNKLDYKDYYSFLNVEKWATLDRIKKAYYTAAKEFHPDRHLYLPSETLKDKLNAIFSHLTVVYKVLSSPVERKQYDNSLTVNPAKLHSDNKELARIRFLEGEEAFRKGDYAGAGGLFGQSAYLDGTVPAYHFNLGLTFGKTGKYHQAAKALTQAVKLEPFNVEYLVELGHIYLKLGFHLRAQSTFEKALKKDPANKSALKGLQESEGARG
jgi:tetratricopeptide (TPR) repeat protein